jgi:hypothetical protein
MPPLANQLEGGAVVKSREKDPASDHVYKALNANHHDEVK